MARIAGVELPKNKRMEIALTYVYGIGRPGAIKILIIVLFVALIVGVGLLVLRGFRESRRKKE